ncbi:MAG: TM0106 family RecB-like putative nuclease [Patescibacteria group bacterium]
MPGKKDFLTASDYYRFLNCPHWPYYDRFATDEDKLLKRDMTESEEKRLEDGLLHEKKIVENLFKEKGLEKAPEGISTQEAFNLTLKWMREGAPFIYQAALIDDDWAGRPDILKKVEGESELGNWYYVPVDIKSAHNVQKYHRLQLMFYAVLLEKIQGRFPSFGYIINKDGDEHEVELGELVEEFEGVTEELEKIRAREKPECVLRKSCFDTGPWGMACQRDAEASNDIALLFNVDVRKLKALRDLGVRTIEDAAAMDPVELDGKAPGLRRHGLEVAKMQAESLLNETVIVREPADLAMPEMEIHFDIESDPPNDMDYLYGFLLRTKDKTEYKPFVAKRPEDEEKMWREFLAWLKTITLPYHVIHFASYEKIRLSVLEKRYGGSKELDDFKDRMIDMKQIIISSIVLPQYFYGLKYVARFLGYKWRGDVKGGGQSVDVFEKYLETGDEKLMQDILIYNEDDVRATALLADWCREYAKNVQRYSKPYPWNNGINSLYKDKR